VQPAPVFNPYHQFYFSDGFVVVPPPTDPYLPSSGKQLLEFIPDFNSNGTNPNAGPDANELGYSGEVGSGENELLGCFNFNAYGASMGCDSEGPDCNFAFTGVRYSSGSEIEEVVTSQSISIPACPSLSYCTLVPVTLNSDFENLTGLLINVTVAGEPKIWWMDDLRLGWFDNSCSAGLCRQSEP